MTEQLTAAIDDAITVAAHRFDAALELLLVEHERLEQLGAMREIAERLAATSSSPPPSSPRTAAEPADTAGHNGVPACAPLPPDELGDAAAAPPAAEPSVGPDPAPPARTTPRAGGTGRDGLSDRQQQLVTAVNALGECTVAQVCERLGLDNPNAVKQALKVLQTRGHIAHNGQRAGASRWLRLDRGGSGRLSPVELAKAEQHTRSSLNGSVEQRVELALKWAKRPMTVEAIVSRCKAHGERSKVQEALAYMEADGRAVCDAAGRWAKTERLAEAA